METFRYRAATASGALRTGALEAQSQAEAMDKVRQLDLRPIEAVPAGDREVSRGQRRYASRAVVASTLGELAVMLDADIPLDRALAVAVDNLDRPAARALFAGVLERVREGAPLSRAMAQAGPSFPPMATAMTAAGEANGRPAKALARLAETLERAEQLRVTIVSAMIYPLLLMVIALGVIALMLLWVVPQFEGLFADAPGKLPPITQIVLAASRLVRRDGLFGLLGLVATVFGLARLARRPAVRAWADRVLLDVPQLGAFVKLSQTARFARVLASLVEGGVALPTALAIARGSLTNSHMAAAVGRVAEGLRQGGGLTRPLAATGVFPKIALSYLRTGEETARLGPMLGRLADVLDRDVRVRVERMIGVLTPLVTVLMGAIVATVIASIMSAIIGFDDLALTN